MFTQMDKNKHSILIIDDQKTNITALSKFLRSEYNIFAAGNGRDALLAAESSQPDVILLDIQMDDMDGYKVITALKGNIKTKDIPVIFITGLSDVESEEKGLALGAVDYIRKPFSPSIVRLRLHNQIKMLEMTVDLKASADRLQLALEEAQEATKAKSIFLSNMSHEIRTPMNAITGMGELLLNEDLEERQMGYVIDIVGSAKSLLGIINDILDFSKIEQGKLEPNPVDYDFGVFIEQIEAMFHYVAQTKGLKFNLERGGDLPDYLYGDDMRLRQALTNIIGNAVKFTEKGHVSLRISASDGFIVFEISDTGVGIKEEDQVKLFKAFEQVDKAINRNVVGTGLGLIISKSFIEIMGGSISLKSEYGRGSKFTVNIPIMTGSKERAEERLAVKEVHTISCPDAKILVVDDNEFNLKVACGLLNLLDVKAATAESGYRAIELVGQNDYDLVFMDHMMPEMDGVEATARMRKMGGKQELLPIVALTANAIQGAKEMFLANGFNDFISKPIDTQELIRVLETWLPPAKVLTMSDPIDAGARLNMEDELRRKSIITFVKENRNTFEKITSSLSSRDIITAHRIAHTLKSSAGYLGKKDLQEAALSLELSLQADQPSYTAEQLDSLINELEKALREFGPMLKEAEAVKRNAVQLDDETLAALLNEIKPLLEKSDFGAAGYVEKLHGITGLEELAERIDDYDFEGALKVLSCILRD